MNMKEIKNNIMSLDQFKDKHYGKIGSQNRDGLESDYQNFKIGALIHEARINKGMTQKELAEKIGTNKSYISKIENDVKEVRLSTLQKIVHLGFGGELEVSIRI